MKYLKLYTRALRFAAEAHDQQVRKYTGEPYILHPIAVAEIVRKHNGTEAMIAAALLHDVIEDTEATYTDVLSTFGMDIANMVMELSDVEDGNRSTRKLLARNRLAAAGAEVQTIKCADILDNTESIARHDPQFARVYLAEKVALLGVLTKADLDLWTQALQRAMLATNRLNKIS